MKRLRRGLAVVMAAVLVMMVLPATPVAAETMEDSIKQQIDTFADALKADGAYDTAMRLVMHSMKGGGKLTMGQDDPFTAGLLHSKLLRASLTHAATVAAKQMLSAKEDKIFMRGGIEWYENNYGYSNSAYNDNENGDDTDDTRRSGLTASQKPYTGAVNGYDEAMLLVVGGSTARYTFEQVGITDDIVTIHVTVRIIDRFDFHGASYSGSDRDLETFLTWLGRLLSLGLLSPFEWSASAELTLEVPNPCTHESASYRWDFDGKQDLANTVRDEFLPNALQKQEGSCENGVFQGTYYTTAEPIRLNHDRPWSLEYRCAGTGYFSLSEGKYNGAGSIYLRKMSNFICFGEQRYVNETDEKQTYCHYGIMIPKSAGIDLTQPHVFRLTNRIYEDGSNMVFLFVDDVEIGSMNNYYHSSAYQGVSDWVCGRDFVINYVGNASKPFTNISVDYIQVWENGADNDYLSYCDSVAVLPGCTEEGYTEHTCSLCGAVFRDSETPATGHSFGDWRVSREPTIHEPGERMRSCDACGYAEYEQVPRLDPARGDVTCDGNINGLDLILLRQYLAGWEVEVNIHAADSNGDGDVNSLDLILLRQYLAGWNVALE